MQAKAPKILALAGTQEARKLLPILAALSDHPLIASLAGVGNNPRLNYGHHIEMRTGGFGGIAGLIAFCRAQQITHILDLTHPYAAKISENARQAALALGLDFTHYHRPAWQPQADNLLPLWREFDSFNHMADALPKGAHLFLAAGEAAAAIFSSSTQNDIKCHYRSLKPAATPLPLHFHHIPFVPSAHESQDELIDFFRKHTITHVICKNSGGKDGLQKLYAARALELPIWVLARPTNPNLDAYRFDDLAQIEAKFKAIL